MPTQRRLSRFLILSTLLALLIVPAAAMAKSGAGNGENHNQHAQFYVPPPNRDAIRQIAQLIARRDKANARLVTEMIATPQAVWYTKGTPKSVRQDVKRTVKLAAATRTVPVLVAYNIPFRDCAQFSAGGATTVQEYKDWIDGFAAGIGSDKAVVILEPDGLGIIPWYNPYGSADGNSGLDWCQPAEANAATAAADRFAMMNYAVDALKAHPNVSVYLDGTHSAWLGSGTWISSCIAYATKVAPGDFFGCPNQYWNGGPLPAKIAQLLGEWTGVALSSFGEWSATTDDASLNTSGINLRYANMLGATQPSTHFVIDTSRNGAGPWQPPAGAYPDPQDWCNPPGRGLGLRPTADTGNALVDAYLWVKIPGESDGECTRGLGPSGTTIDPEWSRIDPAAGKWFPEMALELAQKANPPLR